MTGIKDVANLAGVSISTVSNVLNGSKFVSEELIKKVQNAANELNYEVDPVARNMKKGSSKTIGVLFEDMCGLFYPYVLKGIYDVVIERGYNVTIFDTSSTRTVSSREVAAGYQKEKEGIKLFAANRVDGIIFSSMVQENIEQNFTSEIQQITQAKKRTALVCIQRDFSTYGIDSIFNDSREGGEMATDYLLDLGCKKIGHITGPINFKIPRDRLKGYESALKRRGFPVDSHLIANGDYSHQSGYLSMKRLLSSSPDIDGVFVASDQMAIGACKAIKECGKSIPNDIKVIGYDDVFISSVIEPSLSTIYVQKKSLGMMAAKALLDQIENPEKHNVLRTKLESRLVVRNSTEIKSQSDWILSEW